MPDAAVPEVTFKTAETLHYGGEATIAGLTPEMQAAKAKGAALRQEKASSANAKSFLESYKNKPSESNITRQNNEDLNLKFGAGEAKRNPGPPPTIEVPTTPEAKALFDEAQAEKKNIDNVIQYSEITAEAKKTGKTIIAILTERAAKGLEGPRSQAEFDTQRDRVLDYIINTEVIQKGLPEVAAITDPVQRRKLIEETLTADPALRTKIVEKMVGIAERLRSLPEAPASKEVKDAEDNKKEAQTKITENLDLVRDRLKDLGIDDTTAEALKKEVEKYIKDGKSIDQVLAYLRSESSNQLLTNIPAINEYIKASSAVDVLQRKLEGFDSTKTVQSVIDDVQKKMQEAQEIVDRFEANPALVREFDTYQNIIRAFNNQKDNSSSTTEGGIYLSPVAHGIDQIIKSQKTILGAEKIIKEKGEQSGKATEAWRNDRLVQESNLISEMKNIIPSSIAEVLSNRYDEMVVLEKQRMAKVAEDESKKGNEAIADGIRKVEQAKEKKWIEHDPKTRERQIHSAALGNDIRYAAYAGEDGVKRLILRDSKLPLADASGVLLRDAAGNLVDWKTVDFIQLPEATRKTLEGIYEKQKDSYKQKLFGDFFLGKSFMNRRVFGIELGELALKKHEYELLQTKFGESFEKSINSKAEAQAAVEKLKAGGVKMNGGLLFLLGLLLAGPLLGAKKALGVGE